MKNRIIKICNYALPVLCIANVIASSGDARIAWGIATFGWAAHLLEVRKNAN